MAAILHRYTFVVGLSQLPIFCPAFSCLIYGQQESAKSTCLIYTRYAYGINIQLATSIIQQAIVTIENWPINQAAN